MRIQTQFPLFPEKDWEQKDFREQALFIFQLVQELRQHINGGNLGFGDGIASDNINGVFATYVSNAAPNTEDTVPHNLGVIPIGYLVLSQDKAGSVYKGVTPWTKANLFLKSDTASMTSLLFILAPSNRGF